MFFNITLYKANQNPIIRSYNTKMFTTGAMDHRTIRQEVKRSFFENWEQVECQDNTDRKNIFKTLARSFTSALLIITVIAAAGILIHRGSICIFK